MPLIVKGILQTATDSMAIRWKCDVECPTVAQFLALYQAYERYSELAIIDVTSEVGVAADLGPIGRVSNLLLTTVSIEAMLQLVPVTTDNEPYRKWLATVLRYRADELDLFPFCQDQSQQVTPVCWYNQKNSDEFLVSTALRALIISARHNAYSIYQQAVVKQAEAFLLRYRVALDCVFEKQHGSTPLFRLSNNLE